MVPVIALGFMLVVCVGFWVWASTGTRRNNLRRRDSALNGIFVSLATLILGILVFLR